MGKGDKKSAKGKRIIGSSGVTRQKKKNTYVAPASPVKKAAPTKVAETKKAAPKKAAPKKAAAKKPAAKKASPKKVATKE
tara:strand:- start:25719 stop:25958 length:240 start_codon:yes stop_codon:yes gene_type:complete